MPKYRKKPVVIEAEQWFPGKQVDRVREHSNCYDEFCPCGARRREAVGLISTFYEIKVVTPGDWVITGTDGERSVCKPGIFAATYEEVRDA